MSNSSLTNFDVSDCGTVKYGPYVFMNCRSLETIDMNTNVIPAGAFYRCSKLKTVNIGSTVSYIGEYAFTDSAIQQFSVANGNTTYKPSANKSYLLSADGTTLLLVAPAVKGSFTLPGVTEIGVGAFAGNTGITSVNMPDVTVVNDYAFAECKNITNVTLGKLAAIGKYSFFLTSITTLPSLDGVDRIGDYAFSFTLITEVNVGDGKVIGEGAFCECTEITKVVIGNDVVIGKSAFLRGTTTDDPRNPGNYLNVGNKAVEDIESGFYRYDYLSKLTSLTIGNNADIGEAAFMGASYLTKVTLGDGALIGKMAFYNCRSLFDINLSGAKKIGNMAFSGDNTYAFIDAAGSDYAVRDNAYVLVYFNPIFSSIDLSSCEVIEDQAFIYCKKLTTVKLGDKITEVPYMAFANCDSLTTVNLENVVTIGYAAFGIQISLIANHLFYGDAHIGE